MKLKFWKHVNRMKDLKKEILYLFKRALIIFLSVVFYKLLITYSRLKLHFTEQMIYREHPQTVVLHKKCSMSTLPRPSTCCLFKTKKSNVSTFLTLSNTDIIASLVGKNWGNYEITRFSGAKQGEGLVSEAWKQELS